MMACACSMRDGGLVLVSRFSGGVRVVVRRRALVGLRDVRPFSGRLTCLEVVGDRFLVSGIPPNILETVCRKYYEQISVKASRHRSPWGIIRCYRKVLVIDDVFWLVDDCRLSTSPPVDPRVVGEWVVRALGGGVDGA